MATQEFWKTIALWRRVRDGTNVRRRIYPQQLGLAPPKCWPISDVLNLLSGLDDQGRNAWYAKRDELGQTSGYLDDIRRAQRLIAVERNLWSVRSYFISLEFNFDPINHDQCPP